MMVAFSRSRKPTRPISFDSDTVRSGTSFLRISAARSSIALVTGENTEVTAAVLSPRARIPAVMRINSFSSSGAISRLSNSWPPRTMNVCRPSVVARSSGQSTIGGRPRVAGRPRRTAATSSSRLRSTTALVKCVVPIITASMSATEAPVRLSKSRRTAVMPPLTSAVVGDLQSLRTAMPSMRTASVLVPPTSMPMRIGFFSCYLLRQRTRDVLASAAAGVPCIRSAIPQPGADTIASVTGQLPYIAAGCLISISTKAIG